MKFSVAIHANGNASDGLRDTPAAGVRDEAACWWGRPRGGILAQSAISGNPAWWKMAGGDPASSKAGGVVEPALAHLMSSEVKNKSFSLDVRDETW